MTKQETAMIVGIIVETYPSLSSKPGWDVRRMVDVWTMMLGDIHFEIAKAAVVKVCRDSKFVPTVADIVAAAREFAETKELSAEDAWTEVMRQIRAAGPHKKPEWSNPIIGQAVSAFGWVDMCMSDNIAADRAHFLRIYESMRKRTVNLVENEKVLQIAGVGDVVKKLAEGMGRG